MERYKTIFFDAGNTLIHACPSVPEIYQQVTAEFGVTIDHKLIAERFKTAFKEHIAKLYSPDSRYKISSDDSGDKLMWRNITYKIFSSFDEMKSIDFDIWFERAYERFGDPAIWKTFDDVDETLKKLKSAGYKLAIVSNWDKRLRGILNGIGLADYFDYITISSEILARKPEAKIFQHTLDLLKAEPSETIHVGDLYEEDYIGALNAGITPILLDRKMESTANNIRTIKRLDLLPDICRNP
ncbi:MAG: HAD-IA family hydrolase [Planctomycetes bacterium]|nr:HAD-IA family hydrolase [Planctomycetota bacterium]